MRSSMVVLVMGVVACSGDDKGGTGDSTPPAEYRLECDNRCGEFIDDDTCVGEIADCSDTCVDSTLGQSAACAACILDASEPVLGTLCEYSVAGTADCAADCG